MAPARGSASGAGSGDSRPPVGERLRRAALFLGITWSIAGAFLLLSSGGPWLLARAAVSGWIPEWLVTPRPAPVDCASAVGGTAKRVLDRDTLRKTRVAAYEMGFNLGFVTGARNIGVAATEPPDAREQREGQARELEVPTPAIPPLRRPADALSEFELHMLADPECIGARLAASHSSEHDALYRFGAFVGHSFAYRVAAPQLGPVFVLPLRRYARAAALPEPVWLPLTEPSSARPGREAGAEASAIVDRILAHLQGEGPPPAR